MYFNLPASLYSVLFCRKYFGKRFHLILYSFNDLFTLAPIVKMLYGLFIAFLRVMSLGRQFALQILHTLVFLVFTIVGSFQDNLVYKFVSTGILTFFSFAIKVQRQKTYDRTKENGCNGRTACQIYSEFFFFMIF